MKDTYPRRCKCHGFWFFSKWRWEAHHQESLPHE